MNVTRREFGMLALGGLSSAVGISGLGHRHAAAATTATAGANRSYIEGVQFGLQPYCYHDLPMTRENRPLLIERLLANGMGMVELMSPWVEPNFRTAGVTAEQARARLR